ncbi:hypothetical protein ACH3XW_10775 [Acanthocheilonema viteae]
MTSGGAAAAAAAAAFSSAMANNEIIGGLMLYGRAYSFLPYSALLPSRTQLSSFLPIQTTKTNQTLTIRKIDLIQYYNVHCYRMSTFGLIHHPSVQYQIKHYLLHYTLNDALFTIGQKNIDEERRALRTTL